MAQSTREVGPFADCARALQLTGAQVVLAAVITWLQDVTLIRKVFDLLLLTLAAFCTFLPTIVWFWHILPVGIIVFVNGSLLGISPFCLLRLFDGLLALFLLIHDLLSFSLLLDNSSVYPGNAH